MFGFGGFVPSRFMQWGKDPAWALLSFGVGYYLGEYVFLGYKLQTSLNHADPHRYLYSPANEH